jgi:bacteriorhodopsin
VFVCVCYFVFHLAAYIVYIDWILGTPCLLYNLATLIHCPTSNIIQLITYDILMVGCGFIGTIRVYYVRV